MKGIIAVLAFSLAGLFGCNKPAPPAATAPSASAQSKIKDLGTLHMTNGYETCVKFGPTREARMVPKMTGRHDVQITLTIESHSADGKTAGLSIVQLNGDSEKQFEVSVGDTDYTFTPQIEVASSK